MYVRVTEAEMSRSIKNLLIRGCLLNVREIEATSITSESTTTET